MLDGASNTSANHGMFLDVQGNYIGSVTVNVHHTQSANVNPSLQPASASGQSSLIDRSVELTTDLTKSELLNISFDTIQKTLNKKTRTISVDVDMGSRILHFPKISLPLTYEKVCQQIERAEKEEKERGEVQENREPDKLDQPPVWRSYRHFNSTNISFFIVTPEEHHIQVTDGPSAFTAEEGGFININQPLLHFYHKCFLPATAMKTPESMTPAQDDVSVSKARARQDHSIDIGEVTLRFHRTVRVPDNDKTYPLPPDLGPFEIFNVVDYAERLPESIVSKGGVFISMYQREAMWTSFKTDASRSNAVKISVGNVNALTGQPRYTTEPIDKQDYLAVTDNGQLWLDGICVAPDVIRQFVAMPLGQGYTVEGQVTGKEDVGGLQVDVFQAYSMSVAFTQDGKRLSLFKTPRELGLKISSTLVMEDLGTPRELTCRSEGINVVCSRIKLRPESYASMVCGAAGRFPNKDVGFAAGGRISQKIIRDRLPPIAYNQDNGKRLHITVLNSAYFTTVTGRPPPRSPVSVATYLDLQLPWYTLFDENIPGVSHSPNSFIKSITGIDTSRKENGQNTETQTGCGYCAYQMATMWLSPCTHALCDDCAAGLSENSCSSCDVFVERRQRFAAPMLLPENESKVDHVKAGLIVQLKRCCQEAKDTVVTFRRGADRVSPLRGAAEEQS